MGYGRHLNILFATSAAVLGVCYGVLAGQLDWFPKPQLQRAWNQAEVLLTDNPFSFLVPQVYDRHGARVPTPRSRASGITLVSSMWREGGDWEPQVRVLGPGGETLHKWRIGEALFSEEHYLHGAHLFPNGDLIVNVEYVGTARLDPCGNVQWRLPNRTHHSVTRAEDGTLWIPAQMGDSTTEYSELTKPVLPEQILRVSAGGEVLTSLDLIPTIFRETARCWAGPNFLTRRPQQMRPARRNSKRCTIPSKNRSSFTRPATSTRGGVR